MAADWGTLSASVCLHTEYLPQPALSEKPVRLSSREKTERLQRILIKNSEQSRRTALNQRRCFQLRLPELVVSFSRTSCAPPHPTGHIPRGPRIGRKCPGGARPFQGFAPQNAWTPHSRRRPSTSTYFFSSPVASCVRYAFKNPSRSPSMTPSMLLVS